jgi:hypothetical protein
MHSHPDAWSDEPTREIHVTEDLLDRVYPEIRLRPVEEPALLDLTDVADLVASDMRRTAEYPIVEG